MYLAHVQRRIKLVGGLVVLLFGCGILAATAYAYVEQLREREVSEAHELEPAAEPTIDVPPEAILEVSAQELAATTSEETDVEAKKPAHSEPSKSTPPQPASQKPTPTPTPSPKPTPTPEPEPEPEPDPAPVATQWSYPISEAECSLVRNSFDMYPNPDLQVVRIERDLRSSDPGAAQTLRAIACVPHTIWVVGGTPQSVKEKANLHSRAAQNIGKIPVFVIYNVPDHHQAIWHSGLVGSYSDWIRAFAEGIGDRPAWIIVEPDALPLAYYYESGEQAKRMSQLTAAVDILSQELPQTRIYIDAGHRYWVPEDGLASLLRQVGISKVRGFSFNVSNFYTTEELIPVARSLSNKLGGASFVIDTSRNGAGAPSDGEWCNTWNRKLGNIPNFNTGVAGLDATLWIKPPGESDGWCNGGPQAGSFWLPYALDLVPDAWR